MTNTRKDDKQAVTTLYLVRHCEAIGNISRIFQGHIDEDISDNGARQLERLAERFRAIPLEVLYTSPLIRARKTAQAMNQGHGLPLQTDERLMEIHGGHWEGKPWDELPQLYPAEWEEWNHRPWGFSPEAGEAMPHVYRRMALVLTEIANRNPGKVVGVASHGCAIRNALCWAKGWPIERLNEVEWCENTAVSILEFDEAGAAAAGKIKIRLENDASHLDESLATVTKQSWWTAHKEGCNGEEENK